MSNSPVLSKKIEIIEVKPTHIKARLLSSQQDIKMNKHYFRRQLDCGVLEVVNEDKLSRII